MTRDDAMLLFSKLRDDESTVFVLGILVGVGFTHRGKVISTDLGSGEVAIASVDEKTCIRLLLATDGLVFEYREAREFPSLAKELPSQALATMSLTIEFPDRGPVPSPESIMVLEIPDNR